MLCWLQDLDDQAVALLMQQHKDLGKQSWASSSAAALPPGDWQQHPARADWCAGVIAALNKQQPSADFSGYEHQHEPEARVLRLGLGYCA